MIVSAFAEAMAAERAKREALAANPELVACGACGRRDVFGGVSHLNGKKCVRCQGAGFMPKTSSPGSTPGRGAPPTPPGVATTAFGRGASERAAAEVAGAKVLAGKSTLEEQYQQSLQTPPVQDEIQTLLGQKLSEGWSDPKWWGVQIAQGTGSMLPGLGAAAVGGVGGIPARQWPETPCPYSQYCGGRLRT
jgi:hypothetical protein